MSVLHKHHRKLRSQGGDDSWGNIIELDPWVHDAVHKNVEIAYQHGLLVKSHDDPRDIAPDVPGFCAAVGLEVGGQLVTPGAEKKPRPRQKDLSKRMTASVRFPEGVDGAYWRDLLDEAAEVELAQPDTQFDRAVGKITDGKLLVAVLERFTGRV